MHKKFLLLILVSLMCLFSSTACKRISTKNETKKELVLASFTVLADIIQNIAKNDDFVVRSITKPGIEVHGYKPTPSDLINASEAFVFVDNGFGFEIWSEKFVSNLKVQRITIADGLEPIFISEDSYKGKPNPHAWISPKRGILYVDIIVESLSELRPQKENYSKKMEKLIKINSLKLIKNFHFLLIT